MLARLELILNIDSSEMDFNAASIFHGVIMENIESNYAQRLHSSNFNPFSQYIRKTGRDEIVWQINTLNREAYEAIILPFLEKKEGFYLMQRKQEVQILDKSFSQLCYNELIQKYYMTEYKHTLHKIRIMSPMAFKIKGKYQTIPDLYAIYRNIMNKFDEYSTEYKIFDQEALEHIAQNSHIRDYKLRTTRFYLEKTKIPSILGELIINVEGGAAMKSLVALLLDYSQYSGIGIKTALGMGGCEKVK